MITAQFSYMCRVIFLRFAVKFQGIIAEPRDTPDAGVNIFAIVY